MTVTRAAFLSPLAAAAWIPTLGLLGRPGLPAAERIVVAGMAVVALVRPPIALLVLAACVPLGGAVGLMVGADINLTEPLAMAFLSGWLSNEAFGSKPPLSPGTRRLIVPVVLLATVVAASTVVGMAALQPFVAYPLQFLREVLAFFWSEYFFNVIRFEPFTAGLRFLEGLGLFAAAAILTERTKGLAPALARVTVAAGLGVAALSLDRFAEVVFRNGATWEAFAHLLVTVRVTKAFPDVNAAGSYFAMITVVLIGLAVAARRFRWVWAGAACLPMTALWLTGSRAALVAIPVAGAALLVMTLRARQALRGKRVIVVACVALVLIGVGAAIPFAVRAPGRLSMAQTAQDRWDLARAASAMAAEHPVFGVGVGAFRASSEGYFTPALRRLFPRENAHNNFLQILAELGVVGFVPFLWILGSVGRRVWRGAGDHPVNWPLLGASGGVFAFTVTWLAGHPLLIVEVALAFWIALGACLGIARATQAAGPATDRAPGRWLRLLSAALVVFIVLTVPVRARQAIAGADLDHASIGLSRWGSDETGRRCRWITAPRAQFFVPAAASSVLLPFRFVAADPTTAAEISISLDGREVNRVRLFAGAWDSVAVILPEGASGRYSRVEVDVGVWHPSTPPTLDDTDGLVAGIRMGVPVLRPKPAR